MEAIIRNLLLSIFIPATLAGVSYFALATQERLSRPVVALLTGLEAAIAFAVGYYFLTGGLPFLPKSSAQWFIYVPLVAALAAMLSATFDAAPVRVAVVVVAVALVTVAQVRPLWLGGWKPVQAVWLTGMILAAGTIGWAMLHLIMERVGRPWVMLTFVLWLAFTAVALAASGSVALAQFTGIFAAVIGPLFLLAWWRPAAAVFAIAVPLTALALLAVLVNGRFYSDLGIMSSLLILLSPVVGWALVRFGPDEGLLASGPGRMMAMVIPAAAAAIYAVLTSSPSGY